MKSTNIRLDHTTSLLAFIKVVPGGYTVHRITPLEGRCPTLKDFEDSVWDSPDLVRAAILKKMELLNSDDQRG